MVLGRGLHWPVFHWWTVAGLIRASRSKPETDVRALTASSRIRQCVSALSLDFDGFCVVITRHYNE